MSQVAWVVTALLQALAAVLFAVGVGSFVSLVKGCFVLRRMARAGRLEYQAVILKSPLVPAVSSIAVPQDASAASLGFVRRLLDLHFGRNEVVIVLDGPSEAQLETWSSELRLSPSTRSIAGKLPTAAIRGVYESKDPIRVVVIDKAPGGVVDAWNVGVNAATAPVLAILDPESNFQPEVLLRMIQPMLEAMEETVAVCGGISAPPQAGMAAQFGALESLRAWMTRGAAFAGRNLTMPFVGCSLLVRRAAVVQAGGFTGGRVELLMRLHALALAAGKPYRVAFLPEAVSHSLVPGSIAQLRALVARDQGEIGQAFANRVAVAGPFGWSVLRGLYFTRWVRPIVELTAYILAAVGLALGWVDWATALLVVLATVGMGMVVSMAAVVLREVAQPNSADERRMAAMFFAAIPENLWYRQMRSWWLITGFNRQASLEKQSREGSAPEPPPAASATSR